MSQLIDIKTLGGSCCNNSWRQYTSFSSRVVLSRTPCHFTITTATGQRTKSLYYSLHDVCRTTLQFVEMRKEQRSTAWYNRMHLFSPERLLIFVLQGMWTLPFCSKMIFLLLKNDIFVLILYLTNRVQFSVRLITDDVIKCSKLQVNNECSEFHCTVLDILWRHLLSIRVETHGKLYAICFLQQT